MLRLASLFCVLILGSSCLLTNEFGVRPVNSVPSEEIPAAVALRTANGWRTALGFFEADKGRSGLDDDLKENLYASAFATGGLSMEDKLKDGDFFTRESYDNCLEQAFTGASGGALIKLYEFNFGIPTNDGISVNETNLRLSALFAGIAGAGECRTALIRTGRVFEIGVLRF